MTTSGGKGDWKLTLKLKGTSATSDFVLKVDSILSVSFKFQFNYFIQNRKKAPGMAVFSSTSSSLSNHNSLAVEGSVSCLVDCMPAPSSSNYLSLKERTPTRAKREARKTIQGADCQLSIFGENLKKFKDVKIYNVLSPLKEADRV